MRQITNQVFIFMLLVLLTFVANAMTEYEIQAAGNDEKFVINDELYEAKTYCMFWKEGDRVVFLEGSALGACASAKLYNVDRKESCDVWCE